MSTPAKSLWVPVADADVDRILRGVPERAGSLLLLWIELLYQSRQQNSAFPRMKRADLARRIGGSPRMLGYLLADLRDLGLLSYHAAVERHNGRAGPTVYEIKPTVWPLCNGLPTGQPHDMLSGCPPLKTTTGIQQETPLTPQGGVTKGEVSSGATGRGEKTGRRTRRFQVPAEEYNVPVTEV